MNISGKQPPTSLLTYSSFSNKFGIDSKLGASINEQHSVIQSIV